MQIDRTADRGHARISFRAALRAPFALDIFRARHAARGQIGVQLKRQPAHGRLGLIGMLLAPRLQRGLESALPDVAPGSDYIGDDVDTQRFAHVQLHSLYVSRSLAFIILPVDVRGISGTNT